MFFNLLLFSLGYSAGLRAQDDFFGDIGVLVEDPPTTGQDWSITGWVRQKTSYGLQTPAEPFSRTQRDWSKLETNTFARWDWQVNDSTAVRMSALASSDSIYRLKGEDKFDQEEVDEFNTRFEIKDAYLETQINNQFYVKAGQQTVAWGEAENLAITDLTNTRDRFTFGQQDLENIRLPVPALRVNYTINGFLMDGVATYRAGSDDIAPAYDEFDPLISLRPLGLTIVTDEPDRQGEYLLRLSGHYSHGDWGIASADVNQNSVDVRSISNTGSGATEVRFKQDRFQALGANVNWAQGSWLVFAELGMHFDKRLQPNTTTLIQQFQPQQVQLQQSEQGWPEKNQTLAAFGLEYNGFRDIIISTEMDFIHTHDFVENLAVDQNQLGYSGRVMWNGFNERIQILGVWNQLPNQGGRIWRFTLDYDWSDSIELGLLWVSYSAGRDAPLYPYRHNDSLQLQFEYSFQR